MKLNEQIQKNWKQTEGKIQGKECFFVITLETGGELKKIEIQKCDDSEIRISGLKAIVNSLPFSADNGPIFAIGFKY